MSAWVAWVLIASATVVVGGEVLARRHRAAKHAAGRPGVGLIIRLDPSVIARREAPGTVESTANAETTIDMSHGDPIPISADISAVARIARRSTMLRRGGDAAIRDQLPIGDREGTAVVPDPFEDRDTPSESAIDLEASGPADGGGSGGAADGRDGDRSADSDTDDLPLSDRGGLAQVDQRTESDHLPGAGGADEAVDPDETKIMPPMPEPDWLPARWSAGDTTGADARPTAGPEPSTSSDPQPSDEPAATGRAPGTTAEASVESDEELGVGAGREDGRAQSESDIRFDEPATAAGTEAEPKTASRSESAVASEPPVVDPTEEDSEHDGQAPTPSDG